MSEPAVIVAGHICLDVIPDLGSSGNRLASFEPGRLVEIGSALVTTGGAVSNTGLVLHGLGVPVQLMGKVGDDAFGKTIIDILASYDTKLAEALTITAGEKTSYSIIFSLPKVDRMFLHYPGANDAFSADDIDYEAVAAARIFHFGYPPAMKRMYEDGGKELAEIFRRVKRSGVITSLDMVMPDPSMPAGEADWRTVLENVLPSVDIFLPSIEEMLLMLAPEEFNELTVDSGTDLWSSKLSPDHFSRMSTKLLRLGASIVALKAGQRGLYLRTGDLRTVSSPIDKRLWSDRELWAPCFSAEVADTTGAGDATIAGFLTGILRGLTPSQTLVGAVATGACSVEAVGAVAGVRPWAEVQARVSEGWGCLPIGIEPFGWHFDDDERVWRGPNDHTKNEAHAFSEHFSFRSGEKK
jgi:sugar/nucleoside kinase (ribokinase family)